MSRSSTFLADRVLRHTWFATRTAATSKPFWSAAKAPSAELSARDICRPIRASWSSSAGHSFEQRTAKWIIAAMERIDGDETVPLTHEQLATMLGVGRSYASRVIQTFKAEGVLETRRGSILVRDREALRIRACLCNEAVKNHFEVVLRGVYPTEESVAG